MTTGKTQRFPQREKPKGEEHGSRENSNEEEGGRRVSCRYQAEGRKVRRRRRDREREREIYEDGGNHKRVDERCRVACELMQQQKKLVEEESHAATLVPDSTREDSQSSGINLGRSKKKTEQKDPHLVNEM
ncbi:hypothetical protein RUM43_004190 [Polyplax serrata]|uniref:Uncharacterized protein n=1 Tax=Polyplax serrata TaxID=468196 RepID=A0AAN8SAM9_POLSC